MAGNGAYRRLDGLEAGCFQYEKDRVLLDKINNMPLASSLGSWLVDKAAKNMEYELSGGSAFAVTETSLPEVWRIYRETCVVLGVSDFPPLYVVPEPSVNAFTIGVDSAVICVTNLAVNSCTDDELRYIFGHEIGHVMCAHTKYLTLLRYAAIGGMIIAEATILLALPLVKGWSRASEITADRAGFLACQDFGACCAALLKLSGFPHLKEMPGSPKDILSQQVELHRRNGRELGLASGCWRELSHAIGADHPRIVERYECLREWIEMGYADDILLADPSGRQKMAQNMASDIQRYDLLVQVSLNTADYLTTKFGLDRRDALTNIRKAFLSGVPIKGATSERLLTADLFVRKLSSGRMKYELHLHIRALDGNLVRARLAVPYEDDWAFTPRGLREKMLREHVNELMVGLYQLG